jgi:hypothetical protein
MIYSSVENTCMTELSLDAPLSIKEEPQGLVIAFYTPVSRRGRIMWLGMAGGRVSAQ